MLSLLKWFLRLIRTQWLTIVVSFLVTYSPAVILLRGSINLHCATTSFMEAATVFSEATWTISSSSSSIINKGVDPGENHEIQLRHWPVKNGNALRWSKENPLLLTTSGCDIASWVWGSPNVTHPGYLDCQGQPKSKTLHNTTQLQPYDTIYIPTLSFQDFAQNILQEINTDIIIITGQGQGINQPFGTDDNITLLVYANPWVKGFFCHSGPLYSGAKKDTGPLRLLPFAYGFKNVVSRGRKSRIELEVYKSYHRQVVQNPGPMLKEDLSINVAPNKTTRLFVGPFRMIPSRLHIPRSRKMPLEVYVKSLVQGHYTYSPDGDRPECYRHYEALGVATIPITQLPAEGYFHLGAGPTAFNTTYWSPTQPYPRRITVNRNLANAGYWLEDVERVIGRPLRWWTKINGTMQQGFVSE